MEIKERNHDLKSKGQGRIDSSKYSCQRAFERVRSHRTVELINPIADTVATATYQGADVDWYIKADRQVDKGF